MNNTNTTSSWEEKKQEPQSQSEKTIGSEQNYTIVVIEHLSVKTEWVVIGDQKKRIRHCPTCNKMLIYESKRGYFNGKKKKSLCRDCSSEERIEKYGITLPYKGGCKLSEEHRNKISDVMKKRHRENPHPMIGKKHSKETIDKYKKDRAGENNVMYGKNHTLETRKKISETRKLKNIPGPTISEEGKTKLRLKRIKEIAEDKYNGYQIIPSYNKSACKVFDNINSALGWHGKHAMNGGEHFLAKLGYWIDYYEPTRNIVIEWDEPHHYNVDGTLKEKDIIRQQQIEECLKCKFFRVKENTFDEPTLIAELKTL
jgi:hypothetical protein